MVDPHREQTCSHEVNIVKDRCNLVATELKPREAHAMSQLQAYLVETFRAP